MRAVPGRFIRGQYRTLLKQVKAWRQSACARGVTIHQLKHRRLTNKPRGNYRNIFKAHWHEMPRAWRPQPDQTALELLVEFRARYPCQLMPLRLRPLTLLMRQWVTNYMRQYDHTAH